MKRLLVLMLAVLLGGCATMKDVRQAESNYAANYKQYLAAVTAITDASKIRLECDSPCNLEVPGPPSAVPDRPTDSTPAVAAVMQTQITAGAAAATAGVTGYFALKEAREQGATSRFIAEQNRLESEAREETIQNALQQQGEQITTILDRVIPEEPPMEEEMPEEEPEEEPVL